MNVLEPNAISVWVFKYFSSGIAFIFCLGPPNVKEVALILSLPVYVFVYSIQLENMVF